MELCFTRYLYCKKEVSYNFLITLLEKDINNCLFWAYELYYSGFIYELKEYLLKFYYDFYFTKNYKLESYIYNKLFIGKFTKERVFQVINVLINRSYDMDIFLINHYKTNLYSSPAIVEKLQLQSWSDIKNQTILDTFIKYIRFNTKKEEEVDIILTDLDSTKKALIHKVLKKYPQLLDSILIGRIYINVKKCKQDDKNLVIEKDSLDLDIYTTQEVDLEVRGPESKYSNIAKISAYQILSKIDLKSHHPDIKLFDLPRFKSQCELKECLFYNWLYYCYETPVWRNRINKYKGDLSSIKRDVIFDEDSELFDEFYNHYGLEPDEQSKEIQNKWLRIEENNFSTWEKVIEKWNKNGKLKGKKWLCNLKQLNYLQ
jgi:hypothetical protein